MAKMTAKYVLARQDGYHLLNLYRWMENHPVIWYPLLGGDHVNVDLEATGISRFIAQWNADIRPLTTDDHVVFIKIIDPRLPGVEGYRDHIEADEVDERTFGIWGDTRADAEYALQRCLGGLCDLRAGRVSISYGDTVVGIVNLKEYDFWWEGDSLNYRVKADSGLRPKDVTAEMLEAAFAYAMRRMPSIFR